MQPASPFAPLYAAQEAAMRSVDSYQFTRYSNEDIENNPWMIKRFGMTCYNVVIIPYNAIYNGATFIYTSMESLASRVHDAILAFLMQSETLTDAINWIYPQNLINNHRYCTLLYPARVTEQIVGYIAYVFFTIGMTRTSEHLRFGEEGTTMELRCKEILRHLTESNAQLLDLNEDNPFRYKVHVLQSEYINAFACPGGQIVLYSQLIKEIENELNRNENDPRKIREISVKSADGTTRNVNIENVRLDSVLAALIGHEMTHVASRHSSSHTAYLLLADVVLGLLSFDERIQELAMQVHELVVAVLFKSAEYEADTTGMYLMQQAGYNPLGALYLQEVMRRTQGKAVGVLHEHLEFLATHPCSEKRKCALYAAYEVLTENNQENQLAV